MSDECSSYQEKYNKQEIHIKSEEKDDIVTDYIENGREVVKELEIFEEQVISKIVQNSYMVNPMINFYDPTREYYQQAMQWQAYFEFQSRAIQKQQQLTEKLRSIIGQIQFQVSKIKFPTKKYVHKKNRRIAAQIDRHFKCPYQNCFKSYGSDVSLNLHIKIKHNGGNKTQRQKLALQICQAQLTGQASPNCDLIFPPGYIEQYKLNFINKYRLFKNQQ